jgi:hypothetical protein
MTMTFTREGIGKLLGQSFDQAAKAHPGDFPAVQPRGKTFLLGGDFGGAHQGQQFETYAFIGLDLERNERWMQAQRHFRHATMRNKRRMSFKAMNDKHRRDALMPFLDCADLIEGWLVVFAVSRVGGSLFAEGADKATREALPIWKPSVQERLLRILHLSAFLLSGLSAQGQNVLWIVDQDEIAANTDQLTQLAATMNIVASNLIRHGLGHLRCGTTQSDGGSLELEDLVSICDLAAGAVCEAATGMSVRPKFHQRHIFMPLTSTLSWKSRIVANWLASNKSTLTRLTCFIDLDPSSSRMSATMARWHASPGLLSRSTV